MSRSPTEAALRGPSLAGGLLARFWGRFWGRMSGSVQRPHTVFVEPEGVWSGPTRHDDLQAWCRAHPGCRTRLVLSGRLTLQVMAPVAGAALDAVPDLSAWARHQFTHYHGSAAEHWPVAAWTGEGHGVGGATALHGIDLPAQKAMAQAHGVSLVSAQPWWAVALRAVSQVRPDFATHASAVLALVEREGLTWLWCRGGSVADVQQRRLDTGALNVEPHALAELLAALCVEVPAGTVHCVLGYGCSGVDAVFNAKTAPAWTLLSALGSPSPPWAWVEA